MDERYSSVCAKFEREIRNGQVKIHRAPSADALPRFPDGYFDWIYIDGNHFYEYVKSDLELSFQKTKVGGLVAGDDYIEGGWCGVKKAVDEYAAVKQAQLIEIRNRQFIFRKELTR